jgi:hypothetical protein
MIAMALAVAAITAVLAVVVIALLRAGIAREESDRSLLVGPRTRAASVTRRMVGLYVRTPDRVGDVSRFGGQDAISPAERPPRRPGR